LKNKYKGTLLQKGVQIHILGDCKYTKKRERKQIYRRRKCAKVRRRREWSHDWYNIICLPHTPHIILFLTLLSHFTHPTCVLVHLPYVIVPHQCPYLLFLGLCYIYFVHPTNHSCTPIFCLPLLSFLNNFILLFIFFLFFLKYIYLKIIKITTIEKN